jgi:hypothetical protein
MAAYRPVATELRDSLRSPAPSGPGLRSCTEPARLFQNSATRPVLEPNAAQVHAALVAAPVIAAGGGHVITAGRRARAAARSRPPATSQVRARGRGTRHYPAPPAPDAFFQPPQPGRRAQPPDRAVSAGRPAPRSPRARLSSRRLVGADIEASPPRPPISFEVHGRPRVDHVTHRAAGAEAIVSIGRIYEQGIEIHRTDRAHGTSDRR